jgi:hypothetical protein
VILKFSSEVIFWHGPSPFFFAVIPENECSLIKSVASNLTYGWGCIPAKVKIGASNWKTSLMPKDGKYLLPIKKMIHEEENIDIGSVIKIELDLNL